VTSRGYPVTLVVEGRPCLVVGGRGVALEKARALVDAGALVRVIAPDVVAELAALPGVTLERRDYRVGDAAGSHLIISATGNSAVNAVVFGDAEAHGVLVNAVDDPAHCSFTMPAVLRRGPVTVAISTGGASPALASWLRGRLEGDIGTEVEELARMLSEERTALRSQGVSTEGLPWREVLDAGALDLIRDGRVDEARRLIRTVALERTRWQ
jgi:siroheme synthase-like protein